MVKDDGLAAGKGVVVTEDRAVAEAHAEGVLGDGHPVLVEEFLAGPEVSLFALCDGIVAVPLLPAQDFKRVGDGDSGPNTGGMGAYAPLPWAPDRPGGVGAPDDPGPGVGGARRAGGTVPGSALRRARAHRRRPEGDRVQLPVR